MSPLKFCFLKDRGLVTLLSFLGIVLMSCSSQTEQKKLNPKKAIHYRQGISYDDAESGVRNYTTQLFPTYKTKGVSYDLEHVEHYWTNIYPRIVKAQTDHQRAGGHSNTLAGYHWRPVYYNMVQGTTAADYKLSWCVIPTLVKTSDPKEILDFFDPGNHQYYLKETALPLLNDQGGIETKNSSVIFNTGNMFP